MSTLLAYARLALDVLYARLMQRPRLHGAVAALIALLTAALILPPFGFPTGAVVDVRSDASFREIAAELRAQHIVASDTLLRMLARISATDNAIQAGRYSFPAPIGPAQVLYRLVHGDTGTDAARVTFPEGTSVREMAQILTARIPGFDAEAFEREARPYEGYLFPDTYEFSPDASVGDVITRMRLRFKEVWMEIGQDTANASSNQLRAEDSLPRIVTIASLLEKETKPGPDRALVSGILWHRVDIGMALQVDAVFGYIKGIDTYHPTGKDLEIDSPYNTYQHKDLPPGPIGNPGEDALRAALMPERSPFLYYLSDAEGTVHYAKTFEEHKANKEKYLK